MKQPQHLRVHTKYNPSAYHRPPHPACYNSQLWNQPRYLLTVDRGKNGIYVQWLLLSLKKLKLGCLPQMGGPAEHVKWNRSVP